MQHIWLFMKLRWCFQCYMWKFLFIFSLESEIEIEISSICSWYDGIKSIFFIQSNIIWGSSFSQKNPRPSKIICACLFQNCEGRCLWLGSRWKVRAFADKHSLHLHTLMPRVRREWNVLFTVCETNLVVKSLKGFDTMCYKTYAARTDRPDLEINRNKIHIWQLLRKKKYIAL